MDESDEMFLQYIEDKLKTLSCRITRDEMIRLLTLARIENYMHIITGWKQLPVAYMYEHNHDTVRNLLNRTKAWRKNNV